VTAFFYACCPSLPNCSWVKFIKPQRSTYHKTKKEKRCYAIPMESGEQDQEAIANATDGNHPPPLLSAAAAKKQKAAEEKARRDAHLLQVIENMAWQEAENFTGQCAEADRWL
jgi:hypothetical protein